MKPPGDRSERLFCLCIFTMRHRFSLHRKQRHQIWVEWVSRCHEPVELEWNGGRSTCKSPSKEFDYSITIRFLSRQQWNARAIPKKTIFQKILWSTIFKFLGFGLALVFFFKNSKRSTGITGPLVLFSKNLKLSRWEGASSIGSICGKRKKEIIFIYTWRKATLLYPFDEDEKIVIAKFLNFTSLCYLIVRF